jgi:hypothetical protein
MTTYLFIFAIMAGASTTPTLTANYQIPNWKGQWQYATAFDRPEHCHKAATNLGLKKEEYRCLDITGELK